MSASTFSEAKRWLFNSVSLLIIASKGVARAGDEPLSAIGHYSQETCKGARSVLRGQWRWQRGVGKMPLLPRKQRSKYDYHIALVQETPLRSFRVQSLGIHFTMCPLA